MDKNYAYLRFSGSCDVAEISEILELRPTKSWNAGDKRRGNSNYEFSFWAYESERFEKDFIEDALNEVINFIESFSEKFERVPSYFKPSIVCVGYHEKSFSGFAITRSTIEKLYHLGLDLDFDLYCHAEKHNQ